MKLHSKIIDLQQSRKRGSKKINAEYSALCKISPKLSSTMTDSNTKRQTIHHKLSTKQTANITMEILLIEKCPQKSSMNKQRWIEKRWRLRLLKLFKTGIYRRRGAFALRVSVRLNAEKYHALQMPMWLMRIQYFCIMWLFRKQYKD